MTQTIPERSGVVAASSLAGLLLGAVGLALLSWWLGGAPEVPVEPRLPVTPPELATLDATDPGTVAVDLEGSFAVGPGRPSTLPGSWPRFRGAGYDNVARGSVPLAESWGPDGPPLRWDVELGEGHGGAAVAEGRVYLLDYDEARESDLLRCLSLDDGREIWRRWYRTGAKRNHGISRTVPTVSEGRVLALGPKGHLTCTDAITGDFLWGVDLVRDHGAREPLWLAAQHPVLEGDTAVVAPAGEALLLGLDAATGELRWRTPNPHGWQMSHASVVPMTLAGRRTWVYAALGGMVGVAADGEDLGSVLWETEAWDHAVVAPSPVAMGDDRVLVTAGFGVGSAIFRVRPQGLGYAVTTERSFDRGDFACEQHTPILYRDHLFTVMPKDGGALRSQLVCATAAGELAWSSGRDQRFGLGPFLIADDKLLVLRDDGVLSMGRASTRAWMPLAQAEVLDGRDAWAPMALAGGLLLVRDSRRMVCLDLRREREDPDGGAPSDSAPLRYFEELTIPLASEPTALSTDSDGRLHVAVQDAVLVFDDLGTQLGSFHLPAPATALAVGPEGERFLGMGDQVMRMAPDGGLDAWAFLGESALITSLTVGQGSVWAADAGNRVVWRFDLEGRMQGSFGHAGPGEDGGFVVPSPYFDLALGPDGALWVANPGQQRVQRHALDGALLDSWGQSSPAIEGFSGCCNPSHLAVLPDGSLVTSEKSIPRVKVLDSQGQLRGVVMDPSELAQGAVGLDLAVDAEGRIAVLQPSERAVRVFTMRSSDTGGSP